MVLATAAAFDCVAITLDAPTQIELSGLESQMLVLRVCGQRQEKAEITLRRDVMVPESLLARVTCVSYGTVAGYPALKIGRCQKAEGKWDCQGVTPALRIHDVVVEYVDAVTADEAVEITKYASSLATSNGLDVSGYVVGNCRVGNGRTVPFPGARNFTIACDAPALSITKDCWEGRCRLFVTDVDRSIP